MYKNSLFFVKNEYNSIRRNYLKRYLYEIFSFAHEGEWN